MASVTMLNIPSTRNESLYAYKMPRLEMKVQGRGNGISVSISNMGAVARALRRPPQYITKWFGYEACACVRHVIKGEEESALVMGFHEPGFLQAVLDKFIDKFVCCPQCHLPEVDMRIIKGSVAGSCRKCGWTGELDNEDKLAAYIVKNPADETGLHIVTDGGDVCKKLSKEERRKKKIRKQAKEKTEDGWDLETSGDEGAPRRREKKEKKAKKEKKDKKEKREHRGIGAPAGGGTEPPDDSDNDGGDGLCGRPALRAPRHPFSVESDEEDDDDGDGDDDDTA